MQSLRLPTWSRSLLPGGRNRSCWRISSHGVRLDGQQLLGYAAFFRQEPSLASGAQADPLACAEASMQPTPGDPELLHHYTVIIYPFRHILGTGNRETELGDLEPRWDPWCSRLADA